MRPCETNWNRAGTERCYAHPMPTLLTPPALEVVLQGLHESEIRCGIKKRAPGGWYHCLDRLRQSNREGNLLRDHRWGSAGLAGSRSHRGVAARDRVTPFP